MNVKRILMLAAAAAAVVFMCGVASAAVTVAPEAEFIGETYNSFSLIPADSEGIGHLPDSGDEHLSYASVKANEGKLSGLKALDGYDNSYVVAAWGPYQQKAEVMEEEPTTPSLGTASLLQTSGVPDIKYLLISADDKVGETADKFKDDAYLYCAYQSGDEYVQIAREKFSALVSSDEDYLNIGGYVTSSDWMKGYNPANVNAGVRVFLVKGANNSSSGGGSGSGSGGSSGGGCSAGLAGLALLAVPFIVRRKH